MNKNIVIIDGYRTAFGKASLSLSKVKAADLASHIVNYILQKYPQIENDIDNVIFGNVSSPADSANIARVILLKSRINKSVSAYTVNRNCASGMQSVTSAIESILSDKSSLVISGGVESMSSIPLLYNSKMTELFNSLFKSKNILQNIKTILSFRPNFLSPVIALKQGLTDPIADMIMGKTAENIAIKFAISRKEQDEFALMSHNRAEKSINNNIFTDEIIPIFNNNLHKPKLIDQDEGVRFNQTIEALAKLKPYFDHEKGSVTIGNSSQITDGASSVIISSLDKAKELDLENNILCYVKDFAYMGCNPELMGLGPAYAISKLLKNNNLKLSDIDLFEINEAFSSQVIGCIKALSSKEFCSKELNFDKEIGEIDIDKLNIHGGAISLGHPVGASGNRIILHLAKTLKKTGKKYAIASLCIGGGQGGAILLENKI